MNTFHFSIQAFYSFLSLSHFINLKTVAYKRALDKFTTSDSKHKALSLATLIRACAPLGPGSRQMLSRVLVVLLICMAR